LPCKVGNLIILYEQENPRYTCRRYTSERIMLKELTPNTLKFIKEMPYMSRLNCLSEKSSVPKLIEVELNEK
jgi:hypothetical protein